MLAYAGGVMPKAVSPGFEAGGSRGRKWEASMSNFASIAMLVNRYRIINISS